MARDTHRMQTGVSPATPSRASNIDALYTDARTLAIGVAAASVITLITALEARDPWIAGLGISLALIGVIRLLSMHVFQLVRPGLDAAGLAHWEKIYVIGGAIYLGVLGLFCLKSFGFTMDPFARVSSIAITLAYLVGTPGRSFASPALVDSQIVMAAVPVLAGVTMAGGWYWSISLFVLVPFMISLKTISTRLQGIFTTAINRTAEATRLASELDAALNNMPQGLAMFDATGKVTVMNSRLRQLINIPDQSDDKNITIRDILAFWDLEGVPQRNDFDLIAGIITHKPIAVTASGRSIELRYQGRPEGGGVAIFEDVTESKRAKDEISYLASYDNLTGLLNRHGFRLKAASAELPASLLFVDLDRFKTINDTLGHAIGDSLIAQAAQRLRTSCSESSLIGRYGGDEFVIMLPSPADIAKAKRTAEAVILGLSEPYTVGGVRVTIGASVGIAFAQSGTSIDDLIRTADLALYNAKAAGKGVWRVFQDEMHREAEARRRTEEDLRGAVARGELEIAYQPVWDVKAQSYVSCEALARWRHPTRGLVSPAEFIPIAEDAGLMAEIGEWVLRRACRDCATWPSHICVAVNFSAVQFRDMNLPNIIISALDDAQLQSDRLEAEVTESLLLHDIKTTSVLLVKLRSLGVKLALDDFGTGYSALSYLRQLPFSKLKVDRSFLAGIDADTRALALLRSIRCMAKDLGMSIVVEGVETEAQMSLVSKMAGVDLIQGFYTGRPMPFDVVSMLLQEGGMIQNCKSDLKETS